MEKIHSTLDKCDEGEFCPKDTTEHIVKTLNDIQKTVNSLVEQIDNIKNDIGELKIIKIKNGGGRPVMYQREDFYQMIYDRPKEAIERASWFSKNATQIIQFILTNATILYLLMGQKG